MAEPQILSETGNSPVSKAWAKFTTENQGRIYAIGVDVKKEHNNRRDDHR
jgi:hypothetical protein